MTRILSFVKTKTKTKKENDVKTAVLDENKTKRRVICLGHSSAPFKTDRVCPATSCPLITV